VRQYVFNRDPAGEIENALMFVQSLEVQVYSHFSFFNPEYIPSPDDVALWIRNDEPYSGVHTSVSPRAWAAAMQAYSSGNRYVWSVITRPVDVAPDSSIVPPLAECVECN
jgi:hypothetical protein